MSVKIMLAKELLDDIEAIRTTLVTIASKELIKQMRGEIREAVLGGVSPEGSTGFLIRDVAIPQWVIEKAYRYGVSQIRPVLIGTGEKMKVKYQWLTKRGWKDVNDTTKNKSKKRRHS